MNIRSSKDGLTPKLTKTEQNQLATVFNLLSTIAKVMPEGGLAWTVAGGLESILDCIDDKGVYTEPPVEEQPASPSKSSAKE